MGGNSRRGPQWHKDKGESKTGSQRLSGRQGAKSILAHAGQRILESDDSHRS